MTHHVTSLVTAGFLIVWAITQRGHARRRVLFGAAVAVVGTASWVLVQWSALHAYFSPLIDSAASQVSNGPQDVPSAEPRVPFSNAVEPTPAWERVLLVYYAAALTLVASWLVLRCVGSVIRRARQASPPSDALRWEPPLLLVLLAAMVPLTMAGHAFPSWAEIGDRSTSFLFLPLSLLVAAAAVYWPGFAPTVHPGARSRRRNVAVRCLAVLLATGVFIGGLVMGGGSDWGRLPGRYLPSADNRSMDAETLAAVRWAGYALPAGSRIGADRVGAALLASQSDLWPVMPAPGDRLAVADLYYTLKGFASPEWNGILSQLVRDLHLRYLYVDRRLAEGWPTVGYYFYEAEADYPRRLTRDELTKFDSVSDIRAVYRHGPITIYDLSGLGVTELRSGWHGKNNPIGVPMQTLIGILSGVVLGLISRSRAGYAVRRLVARFQTAAGPSLTFTAAVGALCIASVAMLSAHAWLGPTVFLSMALIVLLFNPHGGVYLAKKLRNSVAPLHWRSIAASIVVALIVAAAVAQSIRDAYAVDVLKVQAILDDPDAVQVSA
jgi:hypothetical protein